MKRYVQNMVIPLKSAFKTSDLKTTTLRITMEDNTIAKEELPICTGESVEMIVHCEKEFAEIALEYELEDNDLFNFFSENTSW